MIEKVYYINLKHREDRKNQIEYYLKQMGLFDVSERIDAIYHKIGAYGCCLSHIKVLETFLESGCNNCLILEDDFGFSDINFSKESIKKLFNDNVKFDVVQLTGKNISIEDSQYEYLKKVNESKTTSGYIIKKFFVPKLLEIYNESKESLEKIGYIRGNNAIDVKWIKLQSITNWYVFDPSLGKQIPSYSDIEKKFMERGH
jgi:GR25 family glycosyltransferase involved in LPS biosynthesis